MSDELSVPDALRELADLDREVACLDSAIRDLKAERDEKAERRGRLNARLIPVFQRFSPLAVIESPAAGLYLLHQGRVTPVPRYSSAAAEAVRCGAWPAPAAEPQPKTERNRFGFPLPLPFPGACDPEAAEFGPAADAAVLDGEVS